ncbi:MAG TPA: cation-translocating P-type ATPase [bacterium]|nr:cation-translocating P-type ATPase [bacterium]
MHKIHDKQQINRDSLEILEFPVKGMDCAGCTRTVGQALNALPGVDSAEVYLVSEKAVVRLQPGRVTTAEIRKAIEDSGYEAELREEQEQTQRQEQNDAFGRRIFRFFGLLFGAVLLVVVLGEWMGLLQSFTDMIPAPVWLGLVAVAGYPVFRNVIQAALKGRIISHTLMTVGVIAAIAVGEWAAALIVVFFMRVGEYTERFTAERARRAVKDLTSLAPQQARVERDRTEVEVPISEVRVGETVVIRSGEKIPVDGEVVSGHATVDQSTITGESMPVEVSEGSTVFAATLAQLGSLRIRVSAVGEETTFGRIIQLVEEAEANRADVQNYADKFSGYYLPIVAGIAGLTYLLSSNALATAAVLLVACSCSFALATPVAVLATIGAGAKNGLLIKGGKYLEALAQAEVVLVDKTGTLTLGKPRITDILSVNGVPESELLTYTATAEHDSEHPLAAAVRTAAFDRELEIHPPADFEVLPGQGIRAKIDGKTITVGSRHLVPEHVTVPPEADALESRGKTLLCVMQDDDLIGILAASDTVRPEVPDAIHALKSMGIKHIELLTGDNERTAAALATQIDIPCQAELLPAEKIAVVKQYQSDGFKVVMIGDGINDAPALAQADVGIAMGAAGTDIALESAHIALMHDDWRLVPRVFQMARRTMGVVKGNLGFTGIYNLAGLTFAAMGFLPPILAAAAQSLPDLGILANSSRLLKQK